jgi:hypothetical protein
MSAESRSTSLKLKMLGYAQERLSSASYTGRRYVHLYINDFETLPRFGGQGVKRNHAADSTVFHSLLD